ncbi:MFS transporter [Cupriavidus necator]
MSQVAARLERLPFCSFHIKLLLIGGLGFTFEAMDAAIMAFILPVVRTQWQLTSFETGLLGSSTYIGFLVGAFIAGVLGDRFGRRVVMMWALFIFCSLSLVNAFVSDWHTFFVIRALAGVGLGAILFTSQPLWGRFADSAARIAAGFGNSTSFVSRRGDCACRGFAPRGRWRVRAADFVSSFATAQGEIAAASGRRRLSTRTA